MNMYLKFPRDSSFFVPITDQYRHWHLVLKNKMGSFSAKDI